jgi:hypothetical protein
MQIKAISLFIASYLVISTVAAPTTSTPEEATAAQKAGQEKSGGGLTEPVKGHVNSLPLLGPLLGADGGSGDALRGVTGQ